MSVTVEDYLSLVESQHKVRPHFMAVLTDYLRPVVDAHNLSDELPCIPRFITIKEVHLK